MSTQESLCGQAEIQLSYKGRGAAGQSTGGKHSGVHDESERGDGEGLTDLPGGRLERLPSEVARASFRQRQRPRRSGKALGRP